MVLIGKTEFTFFSVCAVASVFSFFFFYTENFISLGALALKYHNVVTVKSSTTAEGPNMCEYSCHIWWQIWLFTPFHMTGCGSAGVNASSVDKKALRQPFCPTMSYGCLFFPPLHEDFSLQNKFPHFKSVYETDSGRFTAVSCRVSSNNDPVLLAQLPHINHPPSLTCFQLN